jgi:hypothetical protein
MKKIYIFLPVFCLLLSAGCSPVDQVKWGSVDLFGNQIKVRTITSSIAGRSGSVVWEKGEKSGDDSSEIVVATIRRGDEESRLHFLYNRDSRECTIINFKRNGEHLSPFMIYKYLGRGI